MDASYHVFLFEYLNGIPVWRNFKEYNSYQFYEEHISRCNYITLFSLEQEDKNRAILKYQGIQDYCERQAIKGGAGRGQRSPPNMQSYKDLNRQRMMKKDVQYLIRVSNYEDKMSQFDASRKLQGIKESDFTGLQPYFNDKMFEIQEYNLNRNKNAG